MRYRGNTTRESLATWLVVLAGCGLSAAESPAPGSTAGGAGGTVRQFGAVGDGQADDSEAIQRAVDQGGEVRFPRGTYRLTRPIVVELDRVGRTSLVGDGTATLVMAGPGPAIHLIGTHEGTADPESVKEAVWLRQRTPMVDGLEIVGEHPEAIGIRVEGAMQPILTRVTVRQALHGLHLTRRNRNVLIAECHLYQNRGVGLLLDRLNLHQINVANCHISYNAEGGIVVRGSEIRNLQIACCDIEANMAPDGPATANIFLDCTEGSVREGAITGCTLQHSKAPPGAANIRLLGRSAQEPQKVGFFSIGDNQISDVAINVHLKYARGVALSGNTFFLGHEYHLLVEDSSQVSVGANLFDRNPDYPPGSRDAIVLADCRDCTLTGLHVTSAAADAGLVLRRCRRMNVTGCTILDCAGPGVLLEEVEKTRLSGCLIHNDRPGTVPWEPIRVVGGRDNQVIENLH